MIVSTKIPWHKMARELADAMIDPDIIFRWPLARVLAVFFLDSVKPAVEEIDVNTPEGRLKALNVMRRRKGLPPLTELPQRSA